MKRRNIETEADFATWVEALFYQFNFEFSHTYEQRQYARRSTKGFPDYIAVKPPRCIVAELKSDTGKVKPEQAHWLDLFSSIEVVETYLVRPSDRDEFQEIIMLSHVPNLIERAEFKCSWSEIGKISGVFDDHEGTIIRVEEIG